MPRSRPWRRIGARSALLVGSTLGACLIAEIICRVVVWRGDRLVIQQWESLDRPRLPAGADAALGDLVRRSPDPRILYELLPNLDTRFLGVPVRTDTRGCRGPERPVAKPPNALRIVALGDSVAFGWGVEESATMLRRLETKLREYLPDRQVDLINTAVPGYNTAMEVAVLEAKGLQYAPDVVLVDFCGNDIDLPNLLPRRRDCLALDRSFLWERMRAVLQPRAAQADPWRQNAFDVAPTVAGENRFENDPTRVPPEYAWMVGWENWRRSMRRLVELGHQHGFQVVMTSHWTVPTEALECCRDLGVPAFTAGERVRQYMRENGIADADYVGSVLTISRTDPHPTALHHGLQLEVLWATLMQPGVLSAFLPRGR